MRGGDRPNGKRAAWPRAREYSIHHAPKLRAPRLVSRPTEHSQLKGLQTWVKTGNNLRDHAADLELIFTMLGQKPSTTAIARRPAASGFDENRTSAKEAGGSLRAPAKA